MKILDKEIEDNKQNYTRFVVLQKNNSLWFVENLIKKNTMKPSLLSTKPISLFSDTYNTHTHKINSRELHIAKQQSIG